MVDDDPAQRRGDDTHLPPLLISQAFPAIPPPDLDVSNDMLCAGHERSQKRYLDIKDQGRAGIERDAWSGDNSLVSRVNNRYCDWRTD
jgi:hypothetical protein